MLRDEAKLENLLNEVRDWVKEVAIPNEDRVANEDRVPDEIVDQMRQKGFFGWSVPEEFGGSGLTGEELVAAALELSQCSPAFRARVGTNTGIGSGAVIVAGTEEQKAIYLPKIASGQMTGCFALTEPDAGSEATNIKTTAERDGDDYVLNGSKCYITNAPIADLFTVFARSDPNTKGSKGISAFLVEKGTPGLRAGSPYKKMGQAGSPVSDVYFENCRVPASALLGGEENTAFSVAMKVLNKQRLHLSALCIGPAIRMLDEMVAHASKRVQFGKPIAEYQLVQAMIADSKTEILAATELVKSTARLWDQGIDTRMEGSACKYFASEMCSRVADRAVQIFGGAGFVADHSCIERFYRDTRLFRIYEGTSQIHQLTIAKQVLARAA
ncbi:acyl-CoA dehydrogenase family protein [Ruegeria hyattellae]|uniref:acyl-CoA dehydrogenase family protein n=1 Tax=Ruegeria hyattellae TaxID=3233337 RepID=UPI00355BDE17